MRFISNFDLLAFVNFAVCLSAAFVFGTLIGVERQYRQRSAGLRTNALVALGAAAFVDLGERVGGPGSTQVLAYVVSGIGFLGAGAIMKEGVNIRGLNTAATLWCSAAVGAAAGAALLVEATALTALVIAGNTLLRPLVNAINRIPLDEAASEATYEVRLTATPELAAEAREALIEALEGAHYPVSEVETSERGDDLVDIVATLWRPRSLRRNSTRSRPRWSARQASSTRLGRASRRVERPSVAAGDGRGGAGHREPDIGIVLRLALDEAIAGRVPRQDFVSEVVEDEIAAVGLDGEDGMALSVLVAHDRHQQRLTREAMVDELLALEQGVDFAVALAVGRVVPMVEHRAPMIEIADRLDRGIGERVDLGEGRQDLLGQVDVARRQLAEVAFLGPAAAEVDPAVRNGSRRRRLRRRSRSAASARRPGPGR